MTERLKVEDLKQIQKERHKLNKKIYKNILKDVEEKIKSKNNIGLTRSFITIPYIKIGYPIYNITHAMMYVIKKLTQQGFQIGNIYENKILILWEIQKQEKPILKGILRKK